MFKKIEKNMNKYEKYLEVIRKKGYFKSFKSTTLKEKAKLILSAIPYAFSKKEIEQEKSRRTYLFFKKIKKENNIKNSKYYSIKHILYVLFALPLLFFKIITAWFIVMITIFSIVPITEDMTLASLFYDYKSIDNYQYFIGETKQSDKPLEYALKNHILNPINSFDNLINDNNKKTLNEFKDIYLSEYQIKKEGEKNIAIFEQYIGNNYHYYHLKEKDKKALVILDNNLKTVHYNVTFNNTKVYKDFSKSIDKTEIHFFGESSINKITKDNTNVESLIENRKLIIKDIKNNFSVENQKRLLNTITDVIQKNTVDKELFELENSIDNMIKKNNHNEKTLNNNVLIKNI
jgi:hypothetical protein